MRIAICHQTFAGGDAIGNDILGMCQTLVQCGHEPFVLCDANPHRIDRVSVTHDYDTLKSCDLVVYHHSQEWLRGREALVSISAPVVFKFHNITPPRFFAPYSQIYADRCQQGISATIDLSGFDRPHLWLSDSNFNSEDLRSAGVSPDRCRIAAPFNNADALMLADGAPESLGDKIRFLFVGRFAPNKGHLALLEFCDAYRSLFGADFEMIIVGMIDPSLDGYWQTFAARARELKLTSIVRVHPHLPDAVVRQLFRSAHTYVTFSEHEGFCVPIVEAQAVGLPVVGSGVTAVSETAGPKQFLAGAPASSADFEFYAGLAHAAATDLPLRKALVEQGRRNILGRFTHDEVENAFLEGVIPFLQTNR